MAIIHLYTGTPASERAQRIDDIMRARWGRAALIVPTRSAANRRLESLILESDVNGSWGNPVLTLEDFSLRILHAGGIRVRRIDELERRMLVEGVVRSLASEGRLDKLGDAATSDGFVTHVQRVITQLKQAAVEPARFREVISSRSHASWLDSIVADVYEGYQDALIQTRSYDRVGIYWQAELEARKGRPEALDGVDALLLDGFEDFTPSEFRLIKALEPHVSEVFIGIDGDVVDPSRQDLFAIPRATHGRVRNEMHDVQVKDFPAPPPATHSEYLAKVVFWRDLPVTANGLRANVEIAPCPDLRQEVEYVGRNVKTLILEERVPCGQIAMVFRDLREAAPTVRAVFEEFGIPVALESAVPLEESSLACFVMDLFDVCETWSRHSVLAVIAAPWFAIADVPVEQVALFSVLARRAGIIEGQKEWTDRIRRYLERVDAQSGDSSEPETKRLPHMREALQSLLARLECLAEVSKLLPSRAEPAAFIDGLEAALDRCGAKSAVVNAIPTPVREREQAAWTALMMAMGRIDAWYQREGGGGAIDRDEFVRILRGAFRDTELALPTIDGGVACKTVENIRHDSYDYVFLCGMNEGEFPRPPVVGAIYADADIADFATQKIELDDKHRHAAREMLLFHHGVRAAKTHLVMTWHTQSREGRAASPSPFLTDALELLEPLGVLAVVPEAPLFAPEPQVSASMRDVRNGIFARSEKMRRLYADKFQHVTDALGIEEARQSASAFGPYDGVLHEAGIVDAIAKQYGPDHEFSVNQLESYAGCPFRFFMTRILGVEPEEEPGLEFDPLVRGSILHDVLQAFHHEFVGQPVASIPEAEARDAMRRHLDEVFARRAYRSINTPPKVAQVERARMAILLGRYLVLEREESDEPWEPRHFEVSFGNAHGRSEDPLSKPDPFELATEGGQARFTGRIDRIDTLGKWARIIDYKTTVYVKPADIDAGMSIQLPLYALALEEHLMPGTRCADALFVQIGGKARLAGLETKKISWAERQEQTRGHIASHVSGIRSGQFPPIPYRDLCRECQEHRACRFDSSRIERKAGAAK